MTCESCVFLSDGFRCQRIKSPNYSRKIEAPAENGCARWELHPFLMPKRRVRDG
jgi:hypothetical protein